MTKGKVQAIVVAAGDGRRLGAALPKALTPLYGRPLVVYCLETLNACRLIDSILLVAHGRYLKDFEQLCETYQMSKIKKVLPGGETRCLSVSNGLAHLDLDTAMVVIHDSARPLVTEEIIVAAIRRCARCGAVIVGVPVKPTIKKVEKDALTVQETLERTALWEIQTPQVFQTDIIKEAHAGNKDLSVTDDAILVERLGRAVHIVQGDYRNIKITTQDDVYCAEALLQKARA